MHQIGHCQSIAQSPYMLSCGNHQCVHYIDNHHPLCNQERAGTTACDHTANGHISCVYVSTRIRVLVGPNSPGLKYTGSKLSDVVNQHILQHIGHSRNAA